MKHKTFYDNLIKTEHQFTFRSRISQEIYKQLCGETCSLKFHLQLSFSTTVNLSLKYKNNALNAKYDSIPNL